MRRAEFSFAGIAGILGMVYVAGLLCCCPARMDLFR